MGYNTSKDGDIVREIEFTEKFNEGRKFRDGFRMRCHVGVVGDLVRCLRG